MSHVTTAARPLTAQPDEATEPRLPRSVPPPLVGGGRVLPIIPQDLGQVRQIAEIIARSGAAPKAYRSDGGAGPVDVDMVCAAILVGLEVGLAPMAAVAGIVMLDDGPVLWGDARDGLVAASGLLQDMKEELALDEQGIFVSATCTVWRVGRPTPIVQTVTRAQAALAGWLENDAWKAHPNRMAQMRAKGWANRDAFPDVLKGLKAYDEEQAFIDVTSKGAASTTPPAPRRSDFTAPEPAAPTMGEAAPRHSQEPDTAEGSGDDGWPLHDETGETIGSFPPAQWFDAFEKMTAKLEGTALVDAIDNNRVAGGRIATDHSIELGPIIADGLAAIFALTDDDQAPTRPKDAESFCPDGPKQENIADAVIALIRASTTVARVNQILKANAPRMKSWQRANQTKVTVAADDRLEHLQIGGFDR